MSITYPKRHDSDSTRVDDVRVAIETRDMDDEFTDEFEEALRRELIAVGILDE